MNFFARPLPLVVVSFLTLSGLGGCKKAEAPVAGSGAVAATPTAKSEAVSSAAATTATGAAKTSATSVPDAVKKVLGRWVRPDGGYVLELKNPDLSGKIEAMYLNPSQNRSINVSRAIWMQGAQGLQVAVELNDANAGYSGATYLLGHDAATDRLAGQYTQPQMQQTFEIEFVRQNAVPMR